MEQHPWLLRLVTSDSIRRLRRASRSRSRSDSPSSAGCSSASWPTSSARTTPSSMRTSRSGVGCRQRDELVDRRASARHATREHVRHLRRARARRILRVPARAEQLGAPFPPHGRRRRDRAREHDQGDPRPRSPDLQSDRRNARAVLPERSLGARPQPSTPRPRSCSRAARSPRTRALLAGGAVAIAVAVACSRVLLGVHWMSDVIAGLAFGWAWFGICAIAFGGRFLVLGAPVEQAAEVADTTRSRLPSDPSAPRPVRRRRACSAAARRDAVDAATPREA